MYSCTRQHVITATKALGICRLRNVRSKRSLNNIVAFLQLRILHRRCEDVFSRNLDCFATQVALERNIELYRMFGTFFYLSTKDVFEPQISVLYQFFCTILYDRTLFQTVGRWARNEIETDGLWLTSNQDCCCYGGTLDCNN